LPSGPASDTKLSLTGGRERSPGALRIPAGIMSSSY
jgi:hypothetical protein